MSFLVLKKEMQNKQERNTKLLKTIEKFNFDNIINQGGITSGAIDEPS